MHPPLPALVSGRLPQQAGSPTSLAGEGRVSGGEGVLLGQPL